MQLVLIGDKKLNKIILPQVPSGNYTLETNDDKYNKKVKIGAQDGKWQIMSDEDMSILNLENINASEDKIKVKKSKDQYISRVLLEEFSVYAIKFNNSKKLYLLYCLPVYENNWIHLIPKRLNSIRIGKSSSNEIVYEDKFMMDIHARLSLNNGTWMIENLDKRYGIFVNNIRVLKETKLLQTGDSVLIMGLRIIILGNSIFINNPGGKMKFNKKLFDIEERQEKELLEEDENEDIYEPTEFFYRSPRIIDKIDNETITIEPPPEKLHRGEMPQYLALASSMSMGAMTLVSILSMFTGMRGGEFDFFDNLLQILMIIVMLVSMILIPIIIHKWQTERDKKYERMRQTKYRKYLKERLVEIEKKKEKKREQYFENYVTTEECVQIILNKDKRLWERTIDSKDFLTVNLGVGDIPFDIEIEYPKKNELDMQLEGDNLEDLVEEFTKEVNIIKNVPVTVSLVKDNILAVVDKDDDNIKRFMENLIIQLITFQSYIDFKFVFLLDEDEGNKWEYVKMLPYVWNNEKDFRFFENTNDGIEEISKYLEDEFAKRDGSLNEEKVENLPYYLIITNNYRKIENLKIISNILNCQENRGFSILSISNNMNDLPSKCKTFIVVDDKKGKIFNREFSEKDQKEFTFDKETKVFFDKISKTISNIPIKYDVAERNSLPDYYTFLEMYNVGLIEQLHVLDRWNNNDSTLSLAAPLGVKPSGKLISLDVHEKAHGPHGLIAGSTGSGKSEFIITYILSLAINYHPHDVAFVLIDYKGGGLAGAFQKQDIKLPHLVGTITNIDKEGIQRSLVSIKSELQRRQIWFNEAREMTDEGTIDIYKYQKLYHTGVVKRPIPHLLIICDEFAELKQQQPDFMEELVSVSRIGRSLGVHLILATQKPSGVVDDQMRSNSKFAICLKVQDEGDSSEVIERPDAAYLKQSGRFYLKVGKNDLFEIGQSGWSGAPYFPADSSKKKTDESIKFISNIGTPIKEITDYSKKSNTSSGEQLTNIVRHLSDIAKQEKIELDQLWLDDIPEKIYIKDVKEKYDFKPEKDEIMITVGEYDDPSNQKQGIVNIDLKKGGSVAIYGTADSGKETLMSSMIYDLITTYSSDDVWTYILDFGTESLKIYADAPHVGEVIFANNIEKINRFFTKIRGIVKERKELLSDYNGDYSFYIQSSGKKLPLITIFINGFENISENLMDQYDELLLNLVRDGSKMGIVFIISISESGDLRYRMASNFKQKMALSLSDIGDYSSIFDNIGRRVPARKFGRGFVNIGDNVYEFQTAKSCEPKDYNSFIKNAVENAKKNNKTIAEDIPILPDRVRLEEVKKFIKGINKLPIGLRRKDIGLETYNFKENFVNFISGNDRDEIIQYASNIIDEMKLIKDIEIIILDTERKVLTGKKDLVESYKKLLEAMEDSTKEKVCFVLGIGKFINFLEEYKEEKGEEDDSDDEDNDEDNEDEDYDDEDEDDEDEDELDGTEKFAKIMKECEESEKFTFILADEEDNIREHDDEEWFDKNVIWVGNGVDEQRLIEVNASRKEIVDDCGCSFGYINKDNKTIMIKLLEMREKRDEEDE